MPAETAARAAELFAAESRGGLRGVGVRRLEAAFVAAFVAFRAAEAIASFCGRKSFSLVLSRCFFVELSMGCLAKEIQMIRERIRIGTVEINKRRR